MLQKEDVRFTITVDHLDRALAAVGAARAKGEFTTIDATQVCPLAQAGGDVMPDLFVEAGRFDFVGYTGNPGMLLGPARARIRQRVEVDGPMGERLAQLTILFDTADYDVLRTLLPASFRGTRYTYPEIP